MVTHNMKDAIAHGNRLIMMNKGEIIFDCRGEEKAKLTVPAAVHARSYYTDPTAYQLALERFTENCLAPKA